MYLLRVECPSGALNIKMVMTDTGNGGAVRF